MILIDWIFKRKKKEKQTTFCFCPSCRNELVSTNSFLEDKELVLYKCSKCSVKSYWFFDCPVPILIKTEKG